MTTDCSPPGSPVHGDSPGKNTGSGLPCLSPGDLPNPGIKPRSPALQVDSLPSEPPGKPKNTGVGSLSLLQGISLIQELNQSLLHCRWMLYQLSYQGSPIYTLLCIKEITNENLLYSSGNSTEVLCGNLKWGVWKGRGTGIHLTDSLCCTVEANTTLWSNYIPIKINLKINKFKNVSSHYQMPPGRQDHPKLRITNLPWQGMPYGLSSITAAASGWDVHIIDEKTEAEKRGEIHLGTCS